MAENLNKDIKSFDDNFNIYYRRCVLFAKSFTFDLPQAECFAAEALEVLWEKLSSGEKVEYPIPFLFSVIRNKSLDWLRVKYKKVKALENIQSDTIRDIEFRINTLEACHPHVLYKDDVQTILKSSLETLGAKTKSVFILSRFEGKTNAQIARIFGLTEKAVEYHITKALKRLRADLKDYLPMIALLLCL